MAPSSPMAPSSRTARRAPARAKASPRNGPIIETTVQSLGARGDGLIHLDGTLYFAPDTVPGDRITARVGRSHGGGYILEKIERQQDGPSRVRPFCPHAGACGGCVTQHVAEDLYRQWKVERIGEALARRGLDDVKIDPLVKIAPGMRRRVTLSAVRQGRKVSLGFNARRAHHVVDLEGCPLVVPALSALFTPLRDLCGALAAQGLALDKTMQIVLTTSHGGIDVLFRARHIPDVKMRQHLVAFADRFDLARISWDGADGEDPEAIIVRRQPYMIFATRHVNLPAGGFLQASTQGEQAILSAILGRIDGAKRIAELYCGLGSFTFALAQIAPVHAFEGSASAVHALQKAAGQTRLGGIITAQVRDLDLAPLEKRELKRFDTVVFDPPRAGAGAQAAALAQSKVRTIIAVSCNPATFARDARILIDGGYVLQSLSPIDQFAYSSHVELVAGFLKK